MKKPFEIKKILALLALVLFTAHTVWAVPAKPGLRAYPDGDGGTIMVELCGDENAHFYRSADGYMLMRHADGSFRYAVTDGSMKLVAGSMKAHNAELRTEAERQFLTTIDRETVRTAYDLSLRLKTRRYATAPTTVAGKEMLINTYPTSGSPRSLVVLVEYTDVKFTKENPQQLFNDMCNKDGFNVDGATGSISDYFKMCSNGKFTPQFDVYGPVTLSHPMSYYGNNDGNEMYAHKMVVEACQLLDDEIDFSVYDTDGDGSIDNVYVFYAGYGEADGGPEESVWPHSWDVYTGAKERHYFDGKLLNHYATSNELSRGTGYNLDGIGSCGHEFGHVLGLPDLYSTAYTSAVTPGTWDVMDQGNYNNKSHTPPCYSGYERYCLGWAQPKVLTNPCDVTLSHYSSKTLNDEVYIIPTERDNEFYLLENRQTEEWDKYLPWHGMLVWHIDYDSDMWLRNTVNVDKQYIDLVEADNKQSYIVQFGNPFPGLSGITMFTDNTTPSMRSWSNKALYAPITGITEQNKLITFSFRGGAANKLDPLVADEASDVNKTSFKAHWNAPDNTADILLKVYTKKEDGSRLYLSDYLAKVVTLANEATVTGLENNTTYYYVVQAMKGDYFSDESNEVEVVTADPALGIKTAINTEEPEIKVNGHCITISTCSAADIMVCDMAGRRLHYRKDAVGSSSFMLAPGIYIVKAGNNTQKITVRP